MADRPGARAGSFTLHCRGGVGLFRDGADCTPRSKKGRALLAILAAEQRPLTRTRIIDLLWSDRQEEQARASLRTLLADLKSQFGTHFDELLTVDRERVALEPTVRTDLTDPTLARPAGELFEGLDHIDPQLDEWLRFERGKWANGAAPAAPAGVQPSPARRGVQRRVLGAVLMLALAAVSMLLYSKLIARPGPTVIAVLPIRDISNGNALLAEGVAEELRTQLASSAAINVVGRQSSEALARPGSTRLGRDIGVDYLLEGSVLPGTPARLNLRLVTARGRSIWNQSLPADPARIFTGTRPIPVVLAEQVAETVVPPGPASAFAADAAAYQQLFRARRMIESLYSDEAPEARRILLDVVRRYPDFVPALATLAEATFRSSNHPFYRGPLPLTQARREAEGYALRAVRLAPNFGQAWLALGQARLDTPLALPAFRRAVSLSPGIARAQYRLARALETAGDIEGAIRHQRRFIELDPLDRGGTGMLMQYLAYGDRRAEIEEALQDFRRRSDDTRSELMLEASAANFLGDPSRALVAAIKRMSISPAGEQERRMLMWAWALLGERRWAARYAQPGSLSELILKRDTAGIVDRVEALGPDFWLMNYETMGAAEQLVADGHGKLLVDSYMRSARRLSQDYSGVMPLIVALRDHGHAAEAARLLAESARWIKEATRTSPPALRRLSLADVLALTGRSNDALAALEEGALFDPALLAGVFHPVTRTAAIRGLRRHPRLLALERRYLAFVNRERREAAESLAKIGHRDEAKRLIRPLDDVDPASLAHEQAISSHS